MSAFDRVQNYSSNALKSQLSTAEILGDSINKYDMNSPTDVFLAKLEAEKFNMNELTSVLTCSDDQLIVSGAGSGKSTSLIFKIMYDQISGDSMSIRELPDGTKVRLPDKIWVSTFLKTGAKELREKLGKWQYRLGYPVTSESIEFSTLHAEFKRALNAMGVATNMCPLDYTDSSSASALLKRAINKLNILPVDRDSLNAEDYQVLAGIVLNYRSRLDETKYENKAFSDYNVTPVVLDALVETFRQNRQQAGVLDFEDLQDLLYQYLYITPNAAVQDFIANRYKFIYLDEFQDTSQIQYAILKFYARDKLAINKSSLVDHIESGGGKVADGLYKPYENTGGRIVAIGDDDQSIYGWRGSDVKIISEIFEKDFHPTLSKLTVNYRCPSEILKPVIRSIELNKFRHPKPLVSSNEGGEFNMIVSNNLFDMLKDMYARIEDDVNKGMSVFIVCRTNYDGVLPALLLETKHKFTFSVSGVNMTLNTALPKKLLSMSSLFTERASATIKNCLSMFVYKNVEWKVTNMVKTMKNDSSSIFNISITDVAYSCPELLTIIKTLRSLVLDDDGKRIRENEVMALKWVYNWLLENYYQGDSVFCTSARLYLSILINIIEENDFQSIFEFQDMMEIYSDGLRAKVKKENTQVSIVTAHEVKGKESDSVYLWHDSDGTFPSSKCDLDNALQREEERRVHYIACTRAKKRMTVYGLNSKLGMFARELECKPVELLKQVDGKLDKSTQTNVLEWMQ